MLFGPAKDARFLRKLIYSGATDVCIDGLNEVSPNTHAEITTFIKEYVKGNIIIGTQSI